MAGKGLHIGFEETASGGLVRRTVLLSEDGVRRRHRVVYEFEDPAGTVADRPMDGAVMAVLFHAMERGLPVHVHGPLTRTALHNIDALQGVWRRWRPDRYRTVEIIPETVVDRNAPKPGRRAIAAYSSGLDSTFTILRHRLLLPPERRHTVGALLMVHGFDVELDRPEDFERLVERTRPFRDLVGLDLRVVRTNSKELHLQNWQDSHAAELAACLHLYEAEFEFGLIGSTKPYDALVIPYGTTPIADHLLSGDGFSIVHDGAAYSRTEKAAAVAACPEAVRSLRVCWEGAQQFRNCGVCEKCVRTRMNFAAAGVLAPDCFDGPLDPARIAGIPVRNEPQAAELRSILDYARLHAVEGEWLERLKERVHAIQPDFGQSDSGRLEPRPVRAMKGAAASLRQAAVGLLDAMELKQPLKRVRNRLRTRG
ncbi:hypothetical protein FW320_26730 [Azospirillum sp. Vi22]|uniref:hypothetical protein n=1 Tax=Azospirillum baldaniorum TaxID=1064539 RepID=UPI00157B94BA|nr:hypothetical protein [Azospirillum baldaniorum]NUB09741.1 hypothetical protein [Azospirillum baldaniorum]